MKILSDTILDPKYQKLYKYFNVDQTKYHPRQSIVGKCLLAELLHCSIDEIINGDLFSYGQHGKPVLKNSSLEFNITNSKELVVLVADKHQLGVDLEKMRSFDYHRIERAFPESEVEYLENTPKEKRSRATLKLWTIKEAILKLNGMGIPGGVKSMQIKLPKLDYATRKGKQIKLIPLHLNHNETNYVGTIAQYE